MGFELPPGFADMHEVFACLADARRLAIVLCLARVGEANVDALTKLVALSQSTVSYHLGMLRELGIVYRRRDGREAFHGLCRGGGDGDNNRDDDGSRDGNGRTSGSGSAVRELLRVVARGGRITLTAIEDPDDA